MPQTAAVKDSGRHSMMKREIDNNGGNGDQSESDDGGKGVELVYENKLRWYQRLNPIRLRKPPPVPSERAISKEHGASLLSVITFQWMHPLMMTGYLRPLQLQDIWLVNPDRSVEGLSAKLEASFQKRIERGDKHPLLGAGYETFKLEIWIGACCQMVSCVLQVLTPYTTKYLIAFATEAYIAQHKHAPGPHIRNGIGIAVGITCMQIIQSVTTSQFFFRGMMVGGQARAVLVSMIFSKATRLSGRARAGGKAVSPGETGTKAAEQTAELRKARDNILTSIFSKKRRVGPTNAVAGVMGDGTGWSNGRIVTLMSVDTDRIDKALGLFHLLWTSPIIIILALILLLVNIGYSALSGYALLVAGIPLLTHAIKSLIRRRKKINKITDQRVSLTQEILQAVRFVKFFGWEQSFLKRLDELRKREVRAIQVVLAIRNVLLCIALSLPVFASMLSFITFSLTKHPLNPAPIFSSLALFNTLRLPLNMLPLVLGQVTDAWTALNRIQDFLLAEEQADDIERDDSLENALEIDNASFTWERLPTSEEDSFNKKGSGNRKGKVKAIKDMEKETADSGLQSPTEPFQLTNLSFTAGRNELIAIIGTVGCGKSSLLAALAGDMRMTGGHASMGASRAFCPQYAWIQNATVKENILFGKEYDEAWYNQVIDACALRADLKMLPNGDQTEIGERGITISGGQKQRLNIARAIYFNSSMVLLDDPLSAVDAHVGRHIMDNAICGLLKDKCRILATHQLHVLSRCDRIILMDNGRIEAIDTFDNLMRHNDSFQKLMSSTMQEEEQDKKEEARTVDGNAEVVKASDEENGPPVKAPGALMQKEERAVNSVSWKVWGAYISNFGWPINLPIIVLGLILANGGTIVNALWLSYWVSRKFDFSTGAYIGVYIALGVAQALFLFIFSTTLTISGTNASKAMLSRAINKVLRAPMSFFDTTPLGRMTNRFSKDIHTMDNDLTDAMRTFYLTFGLILAVIALIIVYFHYFAIALIPLLIIFLFAANFYRASARELKRHEAVLRSEVFSQFTEAISGTASIRAYGLQGYFTRRLQKAVDNMDSAYFLTFSNQRWLTVRLDAVGWLMVFVTSILVVTSRFNVDPSISGLVLSFILSISQLLQFTVRQLAEVENSMNATERIHYYGTQLEEEAPLHLRQMDERWPQSGQISFMNVEMRYRAGLPLVLQGLNLNIKGGERIGIVGRTGAGKSSIMSALFRLTELSGGSITIDGIDISTVGLHDLRSRLAIIPQDPALFRGTVRSNLDPFNEHTDLELWSALRQSHLISEEKENFGTVENVEKNTALSESDNQQQQQKIHLDTAVEEEGLNFSLGQRQLMALARALVRGSRIIVCDEATSSVDFETDQKIQETMAVGFKGKTLLCIAHRLRTIINYDRICVMDRGQIAEMDTPLNLWEKEGIFRGMCERSGIVKGDLVEGIEG
ncbi:oligomycin resistance ATP-dependent permease YOR1 [Nannizzia gypsea CBS 118893]|uniref:Oligomycin resistance ATP-dependent permease YOR1 n=1 Tax=Arthroderma gypseum (strain ATCC MYA-4604 / CBS 118893) TaxID=535722 RepID=E4UQF7_ARTGP|nr:oligomycin resistance ATP-dependent permease YOR1 [Nannizzia gypsea CBS 118893]EFR00027.1 oligomycin resistance ATP-dependent permease YOR1 [Nannizzia gypsea CBS 118893]